MMQATYFRDESASDISGIVIAETGDDRVRVTENRDNGWCAPFWMPLREFRTHTHGDSVEAVGVLPAEKMAEVMEVAR